MNQGKYIFSQIMSMIPHKEFQSFVDRYEGDYKTRGFTCWKQFLCMSFGQLTHRESISDLMLCLRANPQKLYHLGIGSAVAVSTLTRANENRSYRIYEDLTLSLITQARALYFEDNNLDMNITQHVFAIDATTIDLCLSAFPWATWRKAKAGIRLHTQLDLKTSIPQFILFTKANVHDINALDAIHFEPNSFYIMDRGYLDYRRLYDIHLRDAFFIVRAKEKMNYEGIHFHWQGDIIEDHTILFTGQKAIKDYPKELRRIQYYDQESGKTFIFLTNNFELKPLEIAQLYKHRWKIELFFKWIKQHLKIKAFWGFSENAVKTQVWIAISTYVLIAITKKKLNMSQSLYEILQVVSVSAFEKTPINQLFSKNGNTKNNQENHNQLKMWE